MAPGGQTADKFNAKKISLPPLAGFKRPNLYMYLDKNDGLCDDKHVLHKIYHYPHLMSTVTLLC